MIDLESWELTLRGLDARLAIAISCGVFLYGEHSGWIAPVASPWAIPVVWAVGLLFGCMWVLDFLQFPLDLGQSVWLRFQNKHKRPD